MGQLKFLVFFLLAFKVIAGINSPYGAQLKPAKAYSVEWSNTLFQTTGYFDYNGAKYPMSDYNSYFLYDSNLILGYGLSSNLEANVLVRGRYVSSQTLTLSDKHSGLESVGIEAKYQFNPIDKNYYAIGVRYRQTMYTNLKYNPSGTVPTSPIILGDDGSEYGVDFYLTRKTRPHLFDLKLSYNSPPNNLSSELNYNLRYLYQVKKFNMGLGFEGIYSLKRDPYKTTPLLKPREINGSTNLFNSINREMLSPYIQLGFDFKNGGIDFIGGSAIKGSSTDSGYFGTVRLSFNIGGESQAEKVINTFKEYIVEGSVIKVSEKGNLLKIDQGLSTDVDKKMTFDIYQTDYFGGNVLVATARIEELGSDWAILKIVKRYSDIQIKTGFQARGH
jgi:hypothetical protein